jgi:demethylmenaquinone methyltransferase/2-methoxy-6-polyprenyl-1,4-benzoquinol methylase
MADKTTHFGYRDVPVGDKARLVRDVFDSVADRYDIMNDLMSLGIHRLWKRFVIGMADIRPGQRVLDLAGGTGDLVKLMAPRVGADGMIVHSDINAAMLDVGRRQLLDRGLIRNVRFAQINAEHLPFPERSFDRVTMAFGLRNVTDKQQVLNEVARVLRPGGQVLVLEFSRPVRPLRRAYDFYSFNVLPKIGQLVANDAPSYRYLAESIRMHPDQETLRGMMEQAGLERCDYHNLTGGIVAVHRGYRC